MQSCFWHKGSQILRARGYSEEVIRAILSHADYLTDYPRVRPIEKALYACDELAGLIEGGAPIVVNRMSSEFAENLARRCASAAPATAQTQEATEGDTV